jgi:hypothetical protein
LSEFAAYAVYALAKNCPIVVMARDLGDGSLPQTGNPITHPFPASATTQVYSVTLSIENRCTPPVLVEKPIAIYPLPVYLPLVVKGYGP